MQQNNLFSDTLKHLKAVETDLVAKLENVRKTIASFEYDGYNQEVKSEVNNKSEDQRDTSVLSDKSKPPYADQYDLDWGLASKFLFLLKMEDRFLHFREAGELIVRLDGEGDPKLVGRKLSSSTLKLKKGGVIVKYQASQQNRDTFWGSPKWLNEDGSIKEGHGYNEEYLSSNEEKANSLLEI